MNYCVDCAYNGLSGVSSDSMLDQARLHAVSSLVPSGLGLFELGQYITEDVEKDVSMVLLENQRRA